MLSIESGKIPDGALLNKYHVEGTYTDCYVTNISRAVSQEDYIFSFYTTLIFKLERILLQLVASKPSTDVDVAQLAEGSTDSFVAWNVEARCENQLLLCDFKGRTRSWLMLMPNISDNGVSTRLYFGSAVVPLENPKTGELSLGWVYRSLLGFHKLYSVVLLHAARKRLEKNIK